MLEQSVSKALFSGISNSREQFSLRGIMDTCSILRMQVSMEADDFASVTGDLLRTLARDAMKQVHKYRH